MKKIPAILGLCAALALSGCENADYYPDSTENSSENSAPTEHTGEPTGLIGLTGEVIYTDEIDGEYSEDFETLFCSGFVYLSKPSGLCFNDRDNADSYDYLTMSFEGAPTEKFKDYIRVNVGEEFCGLTLKSAQTVFQNRAEEIFFMSDGSHKTGAEMGFPEINFTSGECEFDGQLTLSGWACAVVATDIYATAEGDIIFVPDGGCTLPVMNYSFDNDMGVCREFATSANFGMVWANEYGSVTLGNVESTAADISCLPTDGSFVKVSVTIKNITMRSAVDFIDSVTADIVQIELA